jgi:hypothetical protein
VVSTSPLRLFTHALIHHASPHHSLTHSRTHSLTHHSLTHSIIAYTALHRATSLHHPCPVLSLHCIALYCTGTMTTLTHTLTIIFLLLHSLTLTTADILDIYVRNDYTPPSHSLTHTPTAPHARRLAPLDKQPIEPNPTFLSPSQGTDITSKPTKLVSCKGQTKCIAPALQLEKTFNVYYCKRVSHGVRFYYLIREGLTLHPKVNLVDTPDEAEVIVYLPESANWAKSECNNASYYSKVSATLVNIWIVILTYVVLNFVV